MTLKERIQDIVESGQTAATEKTYNLLSEVISIISTEYKIPTTDLLNLIEYEVQRDATLQDTN